MNASEFVACVDVIDDARFKVFSYKRGQVHAFRLLTFIKACEMTIVQAPWIAAC